MKEWISVKERLPEDEETVLIYFDPFILSAEFVRVEADGFLVFHSDIFDDLSCEDITHWMPLPDQPTPENGYRSDLDDGEKSKAFEIIDYLKGLSDDDRRDVLSNFCGVCHDYTGNKHCYCYE